MKKLIHSKYFGLLFLVFFLANSAIAQQYFPVVAKFTQLPPYPIYLADFSNPNQTNLSIQIQMKDNQIASRPIRLKLYIEGQGFRIESTDLVQGEPSITLALGQIYDLPNTQVANYFKQYNLKVSPEQYRRPFSEGTFRFGIEIIDFATNRPLSGVQWSNPVWIVMNEPPVWVVPANNAAQTPQQPQNINFQWAPRHKNVSDVEYEFTITELFVNEDFKGNIQNLFLSQPPYYKVRTRATTLNYNAALPPLLSGRTYAYRVQAIAKRGFEDVGVFRNNGYTEIQHFQYGERLKPPTNLKLDWNEDAKSLTFNWKGQPEHKTFEVEYREKGTNGEWKKRSILPKNGLLNAENIGSLEAFRSYEFKLVGVDAQNQRAAAAPISIEGIAKDVYLKKTEPQIKIEGKIQWAYYASEEPKNDYPTRNPGFTMISENLPNRTINQQSLTKEIGTKQRYDLAEAIVSLYSSEKSDINFSNFSQNQSSLKLIETVSTDKSGKYGFKNQTLKLLKDLKNLYVYVKYKDEAFGEEIKKISVEENSNAVQTVEPIIILANTFRYTPKILPEVKTIRMRLGTSIWSRQFQTITTPVGGDLRDGNAGFEKIAELGLYRLKSVVDKHPYLENEGSIKTLAGTNKAAKQTLVFNGDTYVEVVRYVDGSQGTNNNELLTRGQIFYNKQYNDKFVLKFQESGRSPVIYPVNGVEAFENQKVAEVTDYFRYIAPNPKLKGYVLAPDKANPLADATVQFLEKSYKTDKNGYYEIEIPTSTSKGTSLSVWAIDPLDVLNKTTEQVVYNGMDIEKDIIVSGRTITVTGRVIDDSNTPIQGAKVVYDGKEQTTSSEGIFMFVEKGETLKGDVTVSFDGYSPTTLTAINFTKKEIKQSGAANESNWVSIIQDSQISKKSEDYAKSASKAPEFAAANHSATYKKNHTDVKKMSVGVFENPEIKLNTIFKIKLITYTVEEKRNSLGFRNMKDSATFANVDGYLNLLDKDTDIPKTGYTTTTSQKKITVKVVNKKGAEDLYVEAETSFDLPTKITKKDSVYTFKVKLIPANYFYGVLMDSTIFINGVHSDTSKTKPVNRGDALRVIADAKVSVDDNSVTTDKQGFFKILVPKGQEISVKIEKDGYNQLEKAITAQETEKFSKISETPAKDRKDFYLLELDPKVPKFKTLLNFNITVDVATKNSGKTFVISGKLHLDKGKAGDEKVNMLYKAANTTELTFKDIVVTADPKGATNAIPVLSFINFVEVEAELKLFGYAPVTLEGNPAGEPHIRLQKLSGGKDATTGGKIGGSGIQFTKKEILGVDFGKMELEVIEPEKEKSFGKFNDKISENKKTEIKNDVKAAKETKEANEAKASAEDQAKLDRITVASQSTETAKKTQAEANKTGTEQEKKDAAAAVATAKKEEKDAKNAIPTDVPEKEPLLLVFSTEFLEELRDTKEYKIDFKTTENSAGKNVDSNIEKANKATNAAQNELARVEAKKYFRIVGDVEKKKEALSKAEANEKNANFEKNKVGADENYIKFPVGALSLAGISPISINVEKSSGVLKKSGITMKGIMSFPEVWRMKADKPISVEKLEINTKFGLKQVIFGKGSGESIYELAVGDSWMIHFNNIQIFNDFKGYGIGGKVLNDKENYIIVKSLALSVADGGYYPNIDLDLPEGGFKFSQLRFKTLGKRSISFKSNVDDKSYEVDGSLKIEMDDGSFKGSATDSTNKFGQAITDTAVIQMRIKERKLEEEKKALADKEKKDIEDKKTTEQKIIDKKESDNAKTRGLTIFPLELHRFTWSTSGKFLVAAKIGKIQLYAGIGVNIRRIVYSRAGDTGKSVKKSDIESLLKLTEDEVAKMNSTTNFNDKNVAYKKDSTGTSLTGVLSEEEQNKRSVVSSGNLSVKAVADKVAKADPNTGWAFGIAGGIIVDNAPMGVSIDSDISLLAGDFGKGTEYQLSEAMIKLDIPGGRGMIKVKIATTGEKVGFEGSGDIETAGLKLAGALKLYTYAKSNDVEFGVAFQTSATIPMGSITWTSLGGGIDLDTKLKKYKIFFVGSAINTGTSKKVAEYKAITVSVEFDGLTCGAKPVIKGSMELWTKEEKFCNTSIELDFCKMRVLAKVNCTQEIIEGTKAELNALFIASTSGAFIGATVSAEIMSAKVNGTFALGIECNTESSAISGEISNYKRLIPRYLYQNDNRTFSGVYLGFEVNKEFKTGNNMNVFGVPFARYELEGYLKGKASAGVNFANGNFMIGIDTRLGIEGFMNVLGKRLDGKADFIIIAEGGKTSDLGWNYKAVVGGKIEIAMGDHNNKGCNDFCIICTNCNSNWRWGLPSCERYSNMFLKACVEGRFGIQYREKGYESGYRSIKE